MRIGVKAQHHSSSFEAGQVTLIEGANKLPTRQPMSNNCAGPVTIAVIA